VIALSPEASEQLEALERFYIEKRRPQALRNLGAGGSQSGDPECAGARTAFPASLP